MSQITQTNAAIQAGQAHRNVSPKSTFARRWGFGNLVVWSAFFFLMLAFLVHRAFEHRVDL